MFVLLVREHRQVKCCLLHKKTRGHVDKHIYMYCMRLLVAGMDMDPVVRRVLDAVNIR